MSYLKSSIANPAVPLHDIRSIPGVAGLRRGVYLSWIRRLTLVSSDMLLLSLAWVVARYLETPTQSFWDVKGLEITLIPVLGISLVVFIARRLYEAGKPRRDYVGVIKALSLSTAALLLLTSYVYGPTQFVSQSQFLLFWGFGILFVSAGRLIIDYVTQRLRRHGLIRHPAMVIADLNHREQALKIVQDEECYRITRVTDARALDLHRRERTFEQIQRLGISEVFVAWGAIRNRMFLGQRFQALGITLHVLPVEQDGVFGGAKLHTMSEQVPCVTFAPTVVAGVDFWFKRLFDITFAILFLILASPIYLAVAIAIRLDSSGPIFYKQTRIGLHGEPFKVWKFRSMVQNADKLQTELEQLNQTKDGVLFKIKEDPRITRVGQFIRRYSIDELPQIFNVLLGEMSFVGPRPLPVRDVEKFQERYFIRQDVLPGITGMWQVSGRSDIDNFDDVLKLDLHYIQNWSICLDINILFRTFAAVLKKSGAY
ncbi:MAG: sugar transferase [Leptolyngbya sp. SIO1D8]|nr:sugar transferase [Leptolyngbya sp. SIO1D8]